MEKAEESVPSELLCLQSVLGSGIDILSEALMTGLFKAARPGDGPDWLWPFVCLPRFERAPSQDTPRVSSGHPLPNYHRDAG
ncbi:hypothetical protein JZ751_029383 [Albula glossodonta]|uniref:Uncharacterized protein n=1 Tax=Albula glossodonta TaxID=121402 RepID=A0A8T2P943_9TELE|nr:hypothetical protein JZ751_029383 [Albula glossodonta]